MGEPTAEALLEYLRNLFEKEFEIPQERVIPAARLIEDLELDEKEFKALDTVASLVALVQRRRQGPAGVAS